MKGGPTGRGRLSAVEPQLFQVERINEAIDRANWVFLIDPVI
jgi:hypothetical protein